MEKKEKNYPDCEVATQRNDLIHGQQTLSLVQKRIFALTVQKIQRGDEDYKTYSIEVENLVNAGTSRSIFDRLEKETKKLMTKVLTRRLNEGGKGSFTHWSMVSKAHHVEGEGKLEIDLHPDIRDMLLNLKEQGNFTPVPVAELLACRSTYGQRMYELLYSWRRIGRWETTVNDLRFSLGAEEKYSNFSDFRRSILRKAQKDVKTHTNMRFDWTEECRGRGRGKGKKITHLIFDFSFNMNQMDLPLEAFERPEFNPKFDLINRLKNDAELSEKQVNETVEWLAKNSNQQWPLAWWIHQRIIVPDPPKDSLGNPIRDMGSWTWDKIKKAMQSGGFPEPPKQPKGNK
jgi:plasmid replication initiation protein